MTRTHSVVFACVASAALLNAAGPTRAQPGARYVAEPAAPADKRKVITRSTLWTLRDGAYVAARAPERPLVLCQLLAKNVGPLRNFAADGTALDADTLEKCNSRAKRVSGAAMAATTR